MMNTSATIAGTIAASGQKFTQLAKTPIPLYVNGAWWAFQKVIRPTSPQFGIISRKSTDNGITWVEDDITYFLNQIGTIEPFLNSHEFGNSLLAGDATDSLGDTSIFYKDLDTPNSVWDQLESDDVLPLAQNKGSLTVSYDHFNDQFVIKYVNTSSDKWRFVTTTDFVTMVDPGDSNLTINAAGPNTVNGIKFFHTNSAGTHVLHTVKGTTITETYTSSDLITWTLSALPTTNWNFRDIRWFKGLYIGTRDNDTLFVVHTSTDLISWVLFAGLDESDPTLIDKNFTFRSMALTNDRVVWSDRVSTIETLDGIEFVRKRQALKVAPNVHVPTTLGNPYASTDFDLKGAYINSVLVAGPSIALQAIASHEILGGKIIGWTGDITLEPVIKYPAADPESHRVGFTGNSAANGIGILNDGFDIEGTPFTEPTVNKLGYYGATAGIRYWEATITGGVIFRLGLQVIGQNRFATGNNLVNLTEARIETSFSNIPVTYTVYDGVTIGVVVNFTEGSIQFYADDVLIYDFSPIINDQTMWTQVVDVQTSPKVFLNIGQDPFKYTKAGTVAWADEYL